MEFRCPACNTSYRVPVRIDQQVRCARCDHVWRIAESDFVIAEDMRDENEMPEAFGDFDVDDVAEDPSAQSAGQDLPDDATTVPFGNDNIWASNADDGEFQAEDGRSATKTEAEEEFYAAQPDEAAEPYEDRAPDENSYADDRETGGPSAEDAESFDRRLADSFFSGRLDQPGEAGQPETEPHAAFERIMEGIEEVIAERGSRDDSTAGPSDDPLRALMSRDHTPAFGRTTQADTQAGAPESADDWGGKVVRLTARTGEKQGDARAQDEENMRRGEAEPSEHADTDEPMDDLIDKIAAVRTEALEFAEQEELSGEASETNPIKPAADTVNQAHFEALEADMEDAAHALQSGADDDFRDETAESWEQEGYHDEAHDAALSQSLTFDAEQNDFGEEDGMNSQFDPYAHTTDAAGDYRPVAHEDDRSFTHDDDADDGSVRDEPADIFAADTHRRDDRTASPQAHDDDALLAEYDFGDEELTEAPGEVAGSARRDAGTLTVAAAWALFLTVIAAGAVSTVSFRDQIVEVLPASTPVYAAIGFPVDPPALVFGEVSYSWDGSQPDTLILTGQISNNQSELTELPRLRVAARDNNGELVAEESKLLRQPALLPGETVDFRVNLEVPTERLRTVELSF